VAFGHRRDIQGLRAVAVLLVVLNHAGVAVLSGGYVGVDVFFVLSGFLITGVLIKDVARTGRVNWRDFYARRARRLLPAAGVALICTAVAAVLLLNFIRAQAVLHDSLWAAFFSANIRFAKVGTDYFNKDLPASPLQHFWSLAVEEQFYLVWPMVLSLTLFGRRTFERSPRRRRASPINTRLLAVVLIAIIGLSLSWSVHETTVDRAGAYFSTLTRSWELATGALVAVLAARGFFRKSLARRGIVGWLGLAAISASALVYTPATPFPGSAAAVPVLGTVLVLIGGLWSERNGPGRLLGVAPLTFVGDVSYGFYLWHWPILVIAGLYSGRDLALPTNLLLLGLALAIAVASHYALENPLRRPGRLMRWEPTDGLALWPISVLSLGIVLVWGLETTRVETVKQTLVASAARAVPTSTTPSRPEVDQQPAPSTTTTAPPVDAAQAKVRDAVEQARTSAPLPAAMQPSIASLESGERGDPRHIQGCGATKDQSAGKICSQGAVGATKKVILIGNSHAGMWSHVVQAIALRANYEFVPLLKESCGIENFIGTEPMEACASWYQWALSQVDLIHPEVVVLAITYTPHWSDATATALAQLKSRVPRVEFIGDVPGLEKRPADCLLGNGATMGSCTFRPLSYWPKANALAPRIAAAAGAEFIDIQSWFCSAGFCPTVVGNTITYIDTNHVSIAYSFDLIEPLSAAISLQ
jgi:peptidoglycan/LPS O-acetylase OafA/YrhL